MSPSRFLKPAIFLLIFSVVGISNNSQATAQEGIGERIGERIDQSLEKLGSEIQENWASLRRFVDKLGVQGRVYSRLRWDKQLENAKIDVDVAEGGIVRVSGQVADASAKQQAIRLTENTIGVTRVIDQLQVPKP